MSYLCNLRLLDVTLKKVYTILVSSIVVQKGEILTMVKGKGYNSSFLFTEKKFSLFLVSLIAT